MTKRANKRRLLRRKRQHIRKRALERHGLLIDNAVVKGMHDQIRSGRATLIGRTERAGDIFRVTLADGLATDVIYLDGHISTVLPAEWMETRLAFERPYEVFVAGGGAG